MNFGFSRIFRVSILMADYKFLTISHYLLLKNIISEWCIHLSRWSLLGGYWIDLKRRTLKPVTEDQRFSKTVLTWILTKIIVSSWAACRILVVSILGFDVRCGRILSSTDMLHASERFEQRSYSFRYISFFCRRSTNILAWMIFSDRFSAHWLSVPIHFGYI